MPSKRCATSAKGSGNCSSAAVTNRMACQSRCEIRVQASRRRLLTACSKLSTRRNRAVWGLGCRSAGRLSKRITDDCGRALTCPAAPAFNSPCRRIAELRPGIGDMIAVGEFVTRVPLRVFDFTVFDRRAEDRHRFFDHSRYDFITQMQAEISKPVRPHERQRKYIATQIVAEYLRSY